MAMENVGGGAALKQKEVRKESIFTLGSPERETKSKKDQGFGVFLSACSLCKKKLKPVDDIYMYGYLGAFCSPECRDDQIALDGIDDDEEVVTLPMNMRPSKRFRVKNFTQCCCCCCSCF